MAPELENFVGEACYNLARSILDEYSSRGFRFSDSNDMQMLRKVNAAANVLREMDDIRGYELSSEANDLVRFSHEIQMVKK